MANLDDRIRSALAGAGDHWDASEDQVMSNVARKLARGGRTRTAAAGVVAVAVIVILVAAFSIARRADVPADEPPASPPGPSYAALAVKGVPAGFTRMDDVSASAEQPPRLETLPRRGTGSAYQKWDMEGVWRIVAMTDFGADDLVGLPGLPVEAPADWPFGGHVSLTDWHDTLYLTYWMTDGNRWFLAVTGGTDAERMTVIMSLAAANVVDP